MAKWLSEELGMDIYEKMADGDVAVVGSDGIVYQTHINRRQYKRHYQSFLTEMLDMEDTGYLET